MSDTAMQLADDIAAELNVPTNGPGAAWSQSFTASRLWLPVFSLSPSTSDIPQLTSSAVVSVIPDSTPTNEVGTRGLVREDQNVMLVLQVALSAATPGNSDVDPWAKLLQEFKDWFFHPLYAHWITTTSHQRARCLTVEVGTYCYRPHLEEFHIYTGALTLGMMVHRGAPV